MYPACQTQPSVRVQRPSHLASDRVRVRVRVRLRVRVRARLRVRVRVRVRA